MTPHQITSGLLALLAVLVFLSGVIRAERQAHPVLAQARKDLFGDIEPWHGHPMKPHPHLPQWESHPRYPEYLRIYQGEQRKVLGQIGRTALISGALILISLL